MPEKDTGGSPQLGPGFLYRFRLLAWKGSPDLADDAVDQDADDHCADDGNDRPQQVVVLEPLPEEEADHDRITGPEHAGQGCEANELSVRKVGGSGSQVHGYAPDGDEPGNHDERGGPAS